jgi:hypothetical protein
MRWNRPTLGPALYGSRTRMIGEAGNEIGSFHYSAERRNSKAALGQSVAGGKTMGFNQQARDLLVFCGADVDAASHDWWLHQVTSACRGQIHYDAHPIATAPVPKAMSAH